MAVRATELTRIYRVPVRAEGVRAALVSVWRRRYRSVEAVRGISFGVDGGEIVGVLGPNGAGKTSTLKMLSGILHPSGGEAAVLGYVPWKRDYAFLRQIAMVRGSRPIGAPAELTVRDALRFQQLIYEVPDDKFRRSVAELTELLDLEPLLARQVRALSLGERMRAGLAWSLLYCPRVLFLDEPTIGLDVSAASTMRRFIQDYRRQTSATILLSSHQMTDVELLCRRVILIDRGSLIYDGELAGLAERLAPYRLIKVVVPKANQRGWECYGTLVSADGSTARLQVPREHVSAVAARLLADLPVADLAIEEPSLESVIEQIYRRGMVA